MVDSQATFALLQPPSFDVLPDTDVQLGSVHPRTKTRPRRPDTKRILNRSSRVPVPQALLRSRIDPLLMLDSEKLRSGGAGIKLNLPVLQDIGGGISEERATETIIYIHAHNVETQWFLPDDAYFLQTLQGVEVHRELGGFRTPSVFMVTGVKIAESATIVSGYRKSSQEELGPEIDLTSFGLPVEVSATINARRSDHRIVPIRKSSKFVLAFEVRRIKSKAGGVEEQNFDNFALLDDEEVADKMTSQSLHEAWSLDEVRTELEDE